MTSKLRALLGVVIGTALFLLVGSIVLWPVAAPIDAYVGFAGLLFWILVTTLASAIPVRTFRGALVSVSIAPILAAAALGGPAAGALTAAIGSTERRELRGGIPWYGVLYNHAVVIIPAVVAGVVYHLIRGTSAIDTGIALIGLLAGGLVYFALNESLTAAALSVRESEPFASIVRSNLKTYGLALIGLAPLAWLMALAYSRVGPLVVLLFALPLYTTRSSYAAVVEIRNMFTQTVKALASAIDARDPKTKKHSENVSTIAVEIGHVMGLGEAELEQLEWGGLLHDIGKIGIPDAVLLKPDRLDKAERMMMNSHPERGRQILIPVDKLRPELPLILHHHQWFNGSGYPRVDEHGEPANPSPKPVEQARYERARPLVGEEIPLLARVLHVADAFEAMTARRPYRPQPLSIAQALDELRKYSGIQFDPRVVEAFEKTQAARGEAEFQQEDVPAPADIPYIGDFANQRAKGTMSAAVPGEAQ